MLSTFIATLLLTPFRIIKLIYKRLRVRVYVYILFKFVYKPWKIALMVANEADLYLVWTSVPSKYEDFKAWYYFDDFVKLYVSDSLNNLEAEIYGR